MKVLVLGSEGFIGSHTVKHLRDRGYQVTGADIVLKNEPGYLVINPESPNFSDLFIGTKYDACVNATGAANVQFSYTYPNLDFTLNTVNVYSVLETIRLYNPDCLFINLSSAAVYGNPEQLPIRELDKINPLSPYGLHKLYSEQICEEFQRHFNVRAISLRIFSAYGPGLKKQLFWDLFQKIKASPDHIVLFGTGEETRDFIYVKDLAKAIEVIIKSQITNVFTINVASGQESSIKKTAELFFNKLGFFPVIEHSGQTKIGDPVNWVADISFLKSIGFETNYTLEQGITETAIWIKSQE